MMSIIQNVNPNTNEDELNFFDFVADSNNNNFSNMNNYAIQFVFHCYPERRAEYALQLYQKCKSTIPDISLSAFYRISAENNNDSYAHRSLWLSGFWPSYYNDVLGHFPPSMVCGFQISLPNKEVVNIGLAQHSKETYINDQIVQCPVSHSASWMNTISFNKLTDESKNDDSKHIFYSIMNIDQQIGIFVYILD